MSYLCHDRRIVMCCEMLRKLSAVVDEQME
jgi:hypothetical protein